LARQALQLEPDAPGTLVDVLTRVDPEAAIHEADRIVQQTRTVAGLTARAFVRTELGDLTGAGQDAREAVALDPESEDAVLSVLFVDASRELWDDVLARASNPPVEDNINAAFFAGFAHSLSDRPADAAKALLLVSEQQPRNLMALTILAVAQQDLKAWNDAVLTLYRILAVTPDDDEIRVGRAKTYDELEDYAAVIRDLDPVLAREPTNSWALALRSNAHLEEDRPSQALADADAALAQGAREWEPLARIVRLAALHQLGRRREAEEFARVILAEEPGNPVARAVVQVATHRRTEWLGSVADLAKAAVQTFRP
jgi:tetratricopeptide (TPR) repeat protein